MRMTLCVRMGLVSVALLLGFVSRSTAQEAHVSFRAPLNTSGATLFNFDIAEPPKQPVVALPSVTVVETTRGPRMSNVALKLPPLSIGGPPVAPNLGDQVLPRTFSSSPWAGDFVKRPIRGLGFSTTGSAPVNVLVGQIDGAPAAIQPGGGARLGRMSLGVG